MIIKWACDAIHLPNENKFNMIANILINLFV